jgi:hypothetical protein
MSDNGGGTVVEPALILSSRTAEVGIARSNHALCVDKRMLVSVRESNRVPTIGHDFRGIGLLVESGSDLALTDRSPVVVPTRSGKVLKAAAQTKEINR